MAELLTKKERAIIKQRDYKSSWRELLRRASFISGRQRTSQWSMRSSSDGLRALNLQRQENQKQLAEEYAQLKRERQHTEA